jgi:tetratricopeptide (TPR) repeat protein
MYLQTLGELGIVGLALLATVLGAGFVAGARALRGSDDQAQMTVAALLAALSAFTVALTFDWIWQLPAVAVVGVVALALLCTDGTRAAEPPASRRRWATDARPWEAALAVVSVAAVVALVLPLLSQLKVSASRQHAAEGELASAVQDARRARAITPWNATPYVQVALVAEQGENLAAARAWIYEATRRDSSDWRLWVTAARIEAESGRVEQARRNLARARVLNPRLPLAPTRRDS